MISSHQHAFRTTPALAEDIARCVHCGFCLPACPTYLQLGTETDSPRGRIALIDALASGRAQPTPPLLDHLDLCLQCRACETACPSGVPFGRIMETARAGVLAGPGRPTGWRVRAAVLRALLPHRRRLRVIFAGGRAYQRSGLQKLVRGSRMLRRVAPAIASADASMPVLPRSSFTLPPQPQGLTRSVALLVGCVMPHLYPQTHEATVRVLNRLGYRVLVPEEQTCCGALSMHAGDRAFARDLARRNIDAFAAADVQAVIVNAAGCGSTMKEYAELLDDDPSYRERAERFAAKTKDVLEFVADHDLGPLGDVPKVVTYQDSCHLVHAQKVTRAPRAILRGIPGLEIRELAAPDRCCGSAGIYSFVQSAMAQRLLSEKMGDVSGTGARTVATANPGCMTQLEAGFRQRGVAGEVLHVIELLDEAMRAAPHRLPD